MFEKAKRPHSVGRFGASVGCRQSIADGLVLWDFGGMRDVPFANLAVFVIFFGIALVEALQKQSWIEAALFLALGILSLRADFKHSRQ